MKTSGQFQKKASTQSAPIPLSTNLLRSRPFSTPSTTTEEASTDTPDFQARLEFARSHAPDLSSLAANSSGDRVPSTVQPKLTIGQPNDQYEQEADRVADQVMSMPDSATQQPIQREAMPEEVEMKPSLQQSPNGNLQAGEGIESRLNQSKGGGSPLSDEVRSFMEPRFGSNFEHVQVHTDSNAVQMSRSLGAQAFTHGSDIYYGAGKSPANSDLTAHELTHVMQQTRSIQTKESSEGLIQRAGGEEQKNQPPLWEDPLAQSLLDAAGYIPGIGTAVSVMSHPFDVANTLSDAKKGDYSDASVDAAKVGATGAGVMAELGGFSLEAAAGTTIHEGLAIPTIAEMATVGTAGGSLAAEGSAAAALGPVAAVAGAGLAGYGLGRSADKISDWVGDKITGKQDVDHSLSGMGGKAAYSIDEFLHGVSNKPVENSDGSFSPNDSYKKTWAYKLNDWLNN